MEAAMEVVMVQDLTLAEIIVVVQETILRAGRISGVPLVGPGGSDSFTYSVYRPDGGHWCSVDLCSVYI